MVDRIVISISISIDQFQYRLLIPSDYRMSIDWGFISTRVIIDDGRELEIKTGHRSKIKKVALVVLTIDV